MLKLSGVMALGFRLSLSLFTKQIHGVGTDTDELYCYYFPNANLVSEGQAEI